MDSCVLTASTVELGTPSPLNPATLSEASQYTEPVLHASHDHHMESGINPTTATF